MHSGIALLVTDTCDAALEFVSVTLMPKSAVYVGFSLESVLLHAPYKPSSEPLTAPHPPVTYHPQTDRRLFLTLLPECHALKQQQQ